jgi:hypothetical protein
MLMPAIDTASIGPRILARFGGQVGPETTPEQVAERVRTAKVGPTLSQLEVLTLERIYQANPFPAVKAAVIEILNRWPATVAAVSSVARLRALVATSHSAPAAPTPSPAPSAPGSGSTTSPTPSAPGSSSPIDIATGHVGGASGPRPQEIMPTGDIVELPATLRDIVRPADEAVNLVEVNATFNPMKALIGDFTKGREVFQGKAVLPLRMIIGGVIKALPAAQQTALAPLVAATQEATVIRTTGHLYKGADGAPDARVVPYGGSVGHKHIDAIVLELGKKFIRVVKQMVHFNGAGQGGDPKAIVGDGVAGATHAGGFSAGKLAGKPATTRRDWPADYGSLGDNNIDYNAVLIAVDYRAGCHKPIPDDHLEAYYKSADIWDAVAGLIVPFASQDPDQRYSNYKYNPLDAHDQASLASVATSLSSVSWEVFNDKHGAFYCAEGEKTGDNLGPNQPVKKVTLGATKMGELIETFQKAPGLTRDKPEIGWRYLVSKGLISEAQLEQLKSTGRNAVYLEWVPDTIEPWTKFQPKQKDGLIASPMSVAGLAWGLLRNYLPRQDIANAVVDELGRIYKGGGNDAKAAVMGLLGGQPPTTNAGNAAAQMVGLKAASGFLLSVVSDPEFRKMLLQKAGFEEITNDADKAKVHAAYDEFLGILGRTDVTSQGSLDKAVRQADDNFKKLTVERQDRDHVSGRLQPKRKALMLYFAPQCFGYAAQYPDLFDGHALKYVAHALHEKQTKAARVG